MASSFSETVRLGPVGVQLAPGIPRRGALRTSPSLRLSAKAGAPTCAWAPGLRTPSGGIHQR